MESSTFQTVPLDSMWSLHRLRMESTELVGNAVWSPHGVYMEFPWTLHGVYVEST